MSADPGKMRVTAVSLHVTVLGTGTMGQGIAQVAAQSGHTTRLYDAADGRALTAVKGIGAQLEKLIGKGKITPDQRHQAMNRLSAASAACATSSTSWPFSRRRTPRSARALALSSTKRIRATDT